MTWVLVAITLVSLATAGVLLAYVVRLARDERDRSEARVAALTDLLGAQEPLPPPPILPPVEHDDRAPLTRRVARLDPGEPTTGLSAPELDSWAGLFSEGGSGGSQTRRRFLIPAIGILTVGLVLTAIYALNRPSTTAAAIAGPTALELLSMRHERDGDTLTVSGLVRIPMNGRALNDVTAVVLTFDRQGTFLTSGESPLDFRQLGPGDESPFLVRLPGARTVGRYRVTFRNDDGVVPHVDRRDQPPAAVADAGLGRAPATRLMNHD